MPRDSKEGHARLGLFTGLFYVVTPALKPALRATLGRNRSAWEALKRTRDRLIHGQPLPDGLEAPIGDRARSTFRSWFGSTNGRAYERPLPFGVNVSGFFGSEKGTGQAARATAEVLEAQGVPVVLNNIVDASSSNTTGPGAGVSKHNPYAFNLVCVNADQAANFAWHKGDSYFRGRYSVGVWNWELTDFPEEWIPRFDYFDEIWAGTTFVRDALARVSSVPVTCVPYAVDPDPPPSDLDVERFGVSRENFLFLFMFDFHSVMERKNPLGLIEAFKRAFGADREAALLIKSSRADDAGLAAMREAATGANISILDAVISREEVNALYQACDCYVSLHRSEGFGLTIAEAMVAARPVIATGYSGNMDFMSDRNSFPVRYSLKEIERDHPPYRKGWHWAEPDLDHSAELMRRVFENREQAAATGARGHDDILRLLHPRVVGERMKVRLLEIARERSIDTEVKATAAPATREAT